MRETFDVSMLNNILKEIKDRAAYDEPEEKKMREGADDFIRIPFRTFAGLCKNGHEAYINHDMKLTGIVCDKNVPDGHSWGTCSMETCPILTRKSDGGAENAEPSTTSSGGEAGTL